MNDLTTESMIIASDIGGKAAHPHLLENLFLIVGITLAVGLLILYKKRGYKYIGN